MSNVQLLGREQKIQDSETAFSSVGQILKYYREKRGLTLEEIDQKTHIKSRYLYNLEESINDDMPVAVYVYSYIKQYAKLLGLDGAELVKLYQKQLGLIENSLPYGSDNSINHEKLENENIYLQNKILSKKNISNKENGKNSMDFDILYDNMIPSNITDELKSFPPANIPPKNEDNMNINTINNSQPVTNTSIVEPSVQDIEELNPIITQEIVSATAQAERILLNARREADKIIKDAREQAREFKQGAENYAVSVLISLEQELTVALNEVKNGRQFLKTNKPI